jgi:hypothetical protein
MSKELADLEDEQDSLPFGNDDSLFKAVPVDEPDEAQKQEPQRQPPKKKKPKSTSSPAD